MKHNEDFLPINPVNPATAGLGLLDEEQPKPTLQEDDFAVAYNKSFLSTLRFIRSLGANSDTAEEVAQAAWVRGWQCRHQLIHLELIVAWINTIARNLYLSFIARERRFGELQEFAVPCPLLRIVETDSLMEVCTQSESKILTLYYVEGYTALEIARQENSCPTTVRVRLMRIRRSLRARMTINKTQQMDRQAA